MRPTIRSLKFHYYNRKQIPPSPVDGKNIFLEVAFSNAPSATLALKYRGFCPFRRIFREILLALLATYIACIIGFVLREYTISMGFG